MSLVKRDRKGVWLIIAALVLAFAATPVLAQIQLFGCDRDGRLFSVDVGSGAGTFECELPTFPNPGATEIEFNTATTYTVVQSRDGSFGAQLFDINDCSAIGGLMGTGYAYNGLEYVGGVLYAAGIPQSCEGSELFTFDPANGTSTLIGPTGVGPVAGLAWDDNAQIMYGITGCTQNGPSDLITVDLQNATATVVGNTGIAAGSLEFGPDGLLYAGGSKQDGGNLYIVDTSDGSTTFVGATGFSSVTGLTLGFKTVFGSVDIKPGSCPNPFNVKLFENAGKNDRLATRGVLPVAILGTAEFDVNDIDPSSVRLAGVVPRGNGSEIADVATALSLGDCDCTTGTGDGYDDMTFKFSKQDIAAAIPVGGPGENRTLKLTARLLDGRRFVAYDCIHLVGGQPIVVIVDPPPPPSLSAAYPNPFNPVTTISFYLPEATRVSLTIFNVRGELVASLVDGFVEEGDHNVVWNGRNAASGMYFYRLATQDFSETRKMILLK